MAVYIVSVEWVEFELSCEVVFLWKSTRNCELDWMEWMGGRRGNAMEMESEGFD